MQIYTVRRGDTPASVAARYALEVDRLLSLNGLNDPVRLAPGLALLVPGGQPDMADGVELALCPAPGLPKSLTEALLPSLTWLCLYVGAFSGSGRFIVSDGAGYALAVRNELVLPLLTVSNIGESGGFSAELGHRLLTDGEARGAAIESICAAVNSSGCGGANLSFQYLYPFDRNALTDFAGLLGDRLHKAGRYLMLSLAPAESGAAADTLCGAQDCRALSELADRAVLLSFGWGCESGPPRPFSPVDRVSRALCCALESIPAHKLLLAASPGALDWALPWQPSERASRLSSATAQNLAVSRGSKIRCNAAARSAYFRYTDPRGRRHIVWYDDVTTVDALLRLTVRHSLAGLCWQCAEAPFPTGLALLSSRFQVCKLL